MTRQEKTVTIKQLTELLENTKTIYIADIEGLDADTTSNLRRQAAKSDVKLQVVKNTLLRKAMENSSKEFEGLYDTLNGNSSLMIAEAGNAPAKLIKAFRKKSKKPILKGAFVEEAIYVGDDQLEALSNLKSKEELIGDILVLLQSPLQSVMSGLTGSGQTLSGLLKTLEERKS